MEKSEYLRAVLDQLTALNSDDVLTRHLYQVRAKAMQSELLEKPPAINFSFDEKQIAGVSDYLFSECSLLIKEQVGEKSFLLSVIKRAADAFEYLAKFSSEEKREYLLIKSALCNQVAGYQANAYCLANLVEANYLPELSFDAFSDDFLSNHFRHSLVKFIKRDIKGLYSIISRSLSSISKLQTSVVNNDSTVISDIFSYTGFALFETAMKNFVSYCQTGSEEDFFSTRRNLEKSYTYFKWAKEATLCAVVYEIMTTIELLPDRNTWSAIRTSAPDFYENPLFKIYLRDLANQHSIIEFWQSQLMAIKAGLLDEGKSFVIQMPTSSGKTLIAELGILARLSRNPNRRCLYIAPFRALVNQVERDLTKTLGALGIRVSTLLGGFEFDAFEDFIANESQVLIATPEKADIFLRAHPEYFEDVSLVIIDEGHVVDDGVDLEANSTIKNQIERQHSMGRGALLELLITRLKHILPDSSFLFLSAVMPTINAKDFLDWLSATEDGLLTIDSSQRPSRQTIAKFGWRTGENGELEYISLPALEDGRYPFVPFFIKREKEQYLTGAKSATGKPQKRSWPKNLKNKAQSAAAVACQFARTGSVLVFCATKKDVRSVTANILALLELLEINNALPHESFKYQDNPRTESFEMSNEWFGEKSLLTKALHRGIAFHIGPLPSQLRLSIEDEFKKSNIRILVCTNTLAQGVNLPIKTAIIYSLERPLGAPEEDGSQNIYRVKKRDFWNICGRAGRAGKETEGQIVFMDISENDERVINEYTDPANMEEVTSVLYKILRELAGQRITEDELYKYLDSHILAIMAEEIVDTDDEKAIEELLKRSLVGIQAIRNHQDIGPLAKAIRNTSRLVKESVEDHSLLRVFSKTGLSLSSCIALHRSAIEFLKSVSEESLARIEKQTTCDLTLLESAFRACKDLPEMIFSTTNEIGYQGPEDEYQIIRAWVSGMRVEEIKRLFWNGDDTESLSEYVSDRVTYKLPWGMHSFIVILANLLGRNFEKLPILWQNIPSMVKFGVGDLISAWAGSVGISSRDFCVQLAEKYPDKTISFSSFLRWTANLSADFVEKEMMGTELKKQRLISEISTIIPDNTVLSFYINQNKDLQLPIVGTNYGDRSIAAGQIKIGDKLAIEREPENSIDPNAVKVLFNNQLVGYIPKDKTKLVSQEIDADKIREILVHSIIPPSDTYPFPRIDMLIKFF